ncbi:winged helix-turn-helix domain-containing protein [Aquimarina algiphila]|uniref:winged helix-turn-helix domain-containing protein n=1 Tax=Aquimarina algiphila TaxID=2047982 RepID=UPI00248FBB30|nr:helix-turn-helix domain-containing protein [Aquimarina algiphila]
MKFFSYNIKQNHRKLFGLLFIIFGSLILSGFYQKENPSYFSERVKIALRDIGNTLLLAENDSTSLILPVKEVKDYEYIVSFQNELYIEPDVLVHSIKSTFSASNLPEDYIIEVIDCSIKEVAYSYQIMGPKENDIIPCSGRTLPSSCYKIRVLFLIKESASGSKIYPISALVLLLVSLSTGFIFFRKKKNNSINTTTGIELGKFKFYYELQLLKIEKSQINLTSKESEILKIFSQNPNQLIKRERLIKEVWEDHGIVVGRSLDMFISKLRKKLNTDPSVKIINVHGVGYKIETS